MDESQSLPGVASLGGTPVLREKAISGTIITVQPNNDQSSDYFKRKV